MSHYDVVIAGGGIIGGSIALELAKRKVRVAVLDRQDLMREASWAAAGMLSPAPDCPAAIPLVPLGRASLAIYSKFVQGIEEATGLQTGYRTGGAIEAIFHDGAENELAALISLHRELGLPCKPLALDDLRSMEPALAKEARGAAHFSEECSVEPRKLASAVLAAATKLGVDLKPGVEVLSVAVEKNRCLGVKAATGDFLPAAQVVVATGCWTSQIRQVAAFAPTAPVRGQMAALRHSGEPIRHVVRSGRGYIVPRGAGNPQTIVVGSTIENAGFEKKVTSGGIEKILGAANELVPALANAEIIETWCGLRPGTPDQLPILGPSAIGGLVFATGHYRNGILLAPITSKLVSEWITEQKTSLDCGAFSPDRFARAGADRSATA